MNTVDLTWQRAAKFWWCILWRGTVLGGLAGGFAGFIVGFISGIVGLDREITMWTIRLVSIGVAIPIGIGVTMSALKKRFSDFRLVLISNEEQLPSDV